MSNADNESDAPLFDDDRIAIEWAAYVVGHHPSVVAAWRYKISTASLMFEDLELPPWSEIAYENETKPNRLFDELNQALRLLAVQGAVNAAVLVELHRAIDVMRSTCETFELESIGRSPEDEYWWQTLYEIKDTEQLVGRLLQPDHFALAWLNLGQAIGVTLLELYHPMLLPPSRLSELVAQAGMLAQEQREELAEFAVDASSFSSTLGGLDAVDTSNLFAQLAELDHDILKLLVEGEQTVVLVVDYDNKELRFFGESISFDSFKSQASGGLKVLLALAKHPNAFMTVAALEADTGLSFSEDTLKQYISSFRSVVSPTINRFREPGRPAFLQALAQAFIIAERSQRSIGRDLKYRLALNSAQVAIVGA